MEIVTSSSSVQTLFQLKQTVKYLSSAVKDPVFVNDAIYDVKDLSYFVTAAYGEFAAAGPSRVCRRYRSTAARPAWRANAGSATLSAGV